jgi:N6-L-threonylcarbamoyladenine synthase
MGYEAICREKADRLRASGHAVILALESSCDETAAAIVKDGRQILSGAIYSQVDLHALYGGVVPEIASRAHVEAIDRMVDEALKRAGMGFRELDALAVTYGPGLVGALLTGVSCAKGLAYALGLPLVPVNHIQGHVSANYLTSPDLEPPFICLVASGGHSHILSVTGYGAYTLLGCTRDDAAGEAFDKAARVLSLPYPGGPNLDVLADKGNPLAYRLPRPRTDGTYDFSFSGLKTAFVNLAHQISQRGEPLPAADLAASFRAAVVASLCEKTMAAATDSGTAALALAGGVSANSLLRREMSAACRKAGITLYMPALELCGDNAAMIGSAAFYSLMRGETAGLDLNAVPSLQLIG